MGNTELKRKELFKKIISASDINPNIILNWATGVGKSKAAIDIIKHKSLKEPKILLIVAEIAHKENWYNEFSKWEALQYWNNITIDCYASLKKHALKKYDILILDEAHHSSTELRTDILSTIKAKFVIVLSATLDPYVIDTLTSIYGHFYTNIVTLQMAIHNGLLPKPKIYCIPLQLNNITPNCEITITGKSFSSVIHDTYENRWKYLKERKIYKDTKIIISCTEAQKYQYLSENIEYLKLKFLRSHQEFTKNAWLALGSVRKRFIGDLKTPYLIEVVKEISKYRYICFCSSIEQATLIGKECNTIHSKKIDSKSIIQDFNTKKINKLHAVNMLQEGENLEDIELGILSQLDGKERSFIQKMGRTLRSKSPIQIILYFKDTMDQTYLENSLQDIDKGYVQKVDIKLLKTLI
jgi:superfamily II DNA or RNA helicase